MSAKVTTTINQTKCTGCGLCVEVCPDRTISLRDGKAAITGEKCLLCGHCIAACPTEAVTVPAIAPDTLCFESFHLDNKWLAWSECDTSEVVRLMASRRSCRNYRQQEVARNLLEDLVKIGITAPSGSNRQKWTFTILARREQVLQLGGRMAVFFRKLNRMAANPLLRLFSKLFGGNALGDYYLEYYETVEKGLKEWEEEGRDLLFHGAPALILVGARPGAYSPGEDALLATQNILLAAHSMGLGTCLIGFAVSAMEHDQAIKDLLGIPREEKVYSAIALGYPDETYQLLTGRRPPLVRFAKLA